MTRHNEAAHDRLLDLRHRAFAEHLTLAQPLAGPAQIACETRS
jgi:hypothetical protein